jgi:hypothetical protein
LSRPIIARLHSESHDSDGITVLRDHQRLLQQNLPGTDQRQCRAVKTRSSSQRSNNGIKRFAGIVWLELNLQATLAAIEEYG